MHLYTVHSKIHGHAAVCLVHLTFPQTEILLYNNNCYYRSSCIGEPLTDSVNDGKLTLLHVVQAAVSISDKLMFYTHTVPDSCHP